MNELAPAKCEMREFRTMLAMIIEKILQERRQFFSTTNFSSLSTTNSTTSLSTIIPQILPITTSNHNDLASCTRSFTGSAVLLSSISDFWIIRQLEYIPLMIYLLMAIFLKYSENNKDVKIVKANKNSNQPKSIRIAPKISNNRLFVRKTLTVRYISIPSYLNQTLERKLIIGVGNNNSSSGTNIGKTGTTNRFDRFKMSSIGRVRNRRPSLVEWTQHMAIIRINRNFDQHIIDQIKIEFIHEIFQNIFQTTSLSVQWIRNRMNYSFD
uniref:Uncharacterized protein n=1 Tax=Onchocerca volvulus TaxID=6282 RepID=A0A8R1TIW0_ONCVO